MVWEANVDERDDLGETPLFKACEQGHLSTVQFLFDQGAKLTIKNLKRETPLHKACENGQENVVKFLIAKGVDINAKDREGKTALFKVYVHKHENIVKYLLAYGVNTYIENYRKEIPVHITMKNGYETIEQNLILSDDNTKEECGGGSDGDIDGGMEPFL
ncbi:hypothetical protein PIROE2DRAFT_65018 [Piromyces sp. E2]|nr:hypothetical protein PIROE2DRAFT_65018 [Piromyces sp. E2]|eukprot:OUM57420.1 hypothetical protein PIROE2DRAFT_65018 [Piromyces sp. E2]